MPGAFEAEFASTDAGEEADYSEARSPFCRGLPSLRFPLLQLPRSTMLALRHPEIPESAITASAPTILAESARFCLIDIRF